MAINTLNAGLYGGTPLVVGTSASNAFYVNGGYQAFTSFVVQLTTTGGATYSVQLEGTIDNINWFLLGTPMTADGVYPQSNPGEYVQHIRARVTQADGGASPTIFLYYIAIA